MNRTISINELALILRDHFDQEVTIDRIQFAKAGEVMSQTVATIGLGGVLDITLSCYPRIRETTSTRRALQVLIDGVNREDVVEIWSTGLGDLQVQGFNPTDSRPWIGVSFADGHQVVLRLRNYSVRSGGLHRYELDSK